ncbi:MAG: hypothetical protein EGS53_00825 [Prevotella sp.]|nr:hypothetical protein [Prevotella sp.]
MTSNKQGRQSVIVDRIGYDKEGHTVYTKLGNGTETNFYKTCSTFIVTCLWCERRKYTEYVCL